MLMIDETVDAGGVSRRVFLRVEDGELAVVCDDESFALPPGALDAVLGRYGRPLEEGVVLVEVGALELPVGRIRHVRHRTVYDVIARDFLVHESGSGEPLCALATTVAGALVHLGRAQSGGRDPTQSR